MSDECKACSKPKCSFPEPNGTCAKWDLNPGVVCHGGPSCVPAPSTDEPVAVVGVVMGASLTGEEAKIFTELVNAARPVSKSTTRRIADQKGEPWRNRLVIAVDAWKREGFTDAEIKELSAPIIAFYDTQGAAPPPASRADEVTEGRPE